MLETIVLSVSIVFIFMTFMFVMAQLLKNNSIVDIVWGIGFILISFMLLLSKAYTDHKDIILSLMILVWGFRLAFHIYSRSRGKEEDFRYAQWRKEWGNNAVLYAFIKVFMLQGIIMLFVALPIIVELNSDNDELNLFSFIGVTIFSIGLLFESIGDYQLYGFNKNPENKGRIIKSGLWKYTRHPNYFGEALLWWGIAIFTIGSEVWIISFIGPLILNLLLVFISRIPMLKKKYQGNKEWEAYKNVTPAFIPIIGRKG
jgi:steroid 5-alpha reductase family enzyme